MNRIIASAGIVLSIFAMTICQSGWAQLSHPFDLNSLDGANGVRFSGPTNHLRIGLNISGMGDVNRDGLDDYMICSAPYYATRESWGCLFYGTEAEMGIGGVFDLGNWDGSTGVRFNLPDFPEATIRACQLGDFGGDGIDDLLFGIVGADYQDPSLGGGAAYILMGSEGGIGSAPTANVNSFVGTSGYRFDGTLEQVYVGSEVRTAGDVNGDGFQDALIGAPEIGTANKGRAYLLYGTSSGFGAITSLESLNGSNGVILESSKPQPFMGYAVSSAGDFNGDGYDDFLVNAFFSIEVYLFYGGPSGIAHTDGRLNISQIDGSNGVIIRSSIGGFGRTLASAGDVNSDGYDDILIGASSPGDTGADRGAYLIYGTPSELGTGGVFNITSIDGTNGVHIPDDSGSLNDSAGASVAGAGDVNGDGYDDILIGATSHNDNRGAVYLLYGSVTGIGSTSPFQLSTVNGSNGIRIEGLQEDDLLGSGVSGAGDVNGDGISDILFGGTQEGDDDPYTPGYYLGEATGEAYLIFGTPGVTSAVYREKIHAGNAPARWIGASRILLDFEGGNGPGGSSSPSEEIVTLTRSGAGIDGFDYDHANVVWQIESNRTSWAEVEIAFHYTSSEIAGMNENGLAIYQAPSLSGPWTRCGNDVRQPETNEIRTIVTSFSYFTLGASTTGLEEWGEYR